MPVILSALVPVTFIISIGMIAGRTLTLERSTLSQLAVYILTPALISSSLYQARLSTDSTLGLIIGYLITCVLVYGVSLGMSKLLRLKSGMETSFIATSLFANTGNMGLPFATFALGEAGLDRAIVCLIVSSLIIFSTGPALLQGGGLGDSLRLIVRLPLIWAMIAGLILRVFSIELPLRLDDGLDLLGSAAIPIALIVLGIQLSTTTFKIGLYEGVTAIIRLLVAPAIAYSVGRGLGLEVLDVQVLILQSAMPTAVNTVVLVTQFGGDASWAARTVVVSTVMSLVTLPLVLWVTLML
ncbi:MULTISPECIES: AEC family transporter [unclassified Roseofilum]|uniref:AEC family transporter n=1 Tax=unclassified Roseofilum TaxID=2620099 RepID=UPI000E9280F1|nr:MULTISPECIES: AEC family transporter [unclassified Roseofilum]HBR00457.1 transporter [Cyanobacteria bacterium UBA11691]MBP0008675.1 AEC family transporter [Roseofilum sp. Belize Diploria]MBP0012569.1 AEC family transporter [Roseofilum sp. SID3]MBP0025467.1 AEC family transporter [Roseofilum sp. SID2]MBP0033084.1 AEC family transporter [Roseofilum sp. Belize BBD 4]